MIKRSAGNSKSRVTLRDIADQSGFSISTVSLVLNQAPLSQNLSQLTHSKVQDVAESLGYRPNSFARILKTQRSETVGVIAFDITDPFCGEILRGIERALATTSYLAIMMDVRGDQQQFEHCIQVLIDRRVEALIIVANWLCLDLTVLTRMNTHNVPIIVVGRELGNKPIPSIATDNIYGAQLAIDHLFKLGHREIACLRGPKKLLDSERRWKGITSRARYLGLEVRQNLAPELPQSMDPFACLEGGFNLTQKLIHGRSKFSAVFAFDDLTALGCIRALHQAGKSVPNDVSVVGFDDISLAGLMIPALTTVRQPMQMLGEIGAARMLKAIASRRPAARGSKGLVKLLRPDLVVRESTLDFNRRHA